jgi:hypothetical protein
MTDATKATKTDAPATGRFPLKATNLLVVVFGFFVAESSLCLPSWSPAWLP